MIKVCNSCQRVYRCEEDFYSGTSYWRFDHVQNLYFNCDCQSTLILVKGKYDWYNPANFLSDRAKSVFNSLSLESSIPQLPFGIAKLRGLLASPHIEINQIADALRSEPFILNDVLRTASNMSQNKGQEFKSIDHAIMYVGLKTINELVAVASMRRIEFRTQHFSREKFWEEAISSGVLAENISFERRLCRNYGSEVYLATALANIGKVVYASCLPQLADKIQLEIDKNKLSWRANEVGLSLPDHSVLGEIGATFWALPHSVCYASICHHLTSDHPLKRSEPSHRREFLNLISFCIQLKYLVLDRAAEMDQEIFASTAKDLNFTEEDINHFLKSYAPLIERVLS